MPELTLQVISVDANAPDGVMVRTFGQEGGSLGRDDANFFVLPDKHRRVSRLHASVSFPGGVATITNASASLAITVGDVLLEHGESMPLVTGATIEIGPYLLQARLGNEQVPAQLGSTFDTQLPLERVPSLHAPSAQPPPAPALDSGVASPAVVARISAIDNPPPPTASLPDDFDLLLSGRPLSAGPPAVGQRPSVRIPANALADPFANLLDGIGGPPVALANLAPTNVPGINVDPLQAFGGNPDRAGGGNSAPFARQSTASEPINPFELPSGTGRNSADPLAALLGEAVPTNENSVSGPVHSTPSIDSLFQAESAGGSDPFGLQGTANGLLVGAGHSSGLDSLIGAQAAADPLALFGPSAPLQNVGQRPMRDDSMEVVSSFSPPVPNTADAPKPAPQVALERPPMVQHGTSHAASLSRPVAPVAPPTQSFSTPPIASPDALTHAFLTGARLPANALPQGLTPEVMNLVGSILRSATGGAIDMLAARAATKREVQASVTIISVQANNPLKFMPHVDAALVQLLGKKMPGFMRADVAMRDAFDDLRAHEVGVIAGTRAALTEVLGKFDPALLGDKLVRGSVLESLMPSARKAKLWDLYLERYVQIRAEAEDDFQSIFGRAFVQAYENENARIKNQSGSVSPSEGG
jgi:FHA domain-containing protein